MLEYILNKVGGNQSKAAEMLGLNRNTLRKKMAQYNLQLKSFLKSIHMASSKEHSSAFLIKQAYCRISSLINKLNVEILSTGGTAKLFRDNNIPVIEVGDYTGFPEMLDGRVKTLHPKVHGGILGRRDLPEHVASDASTTTFPNIDMVVVNFTRSKQLWQTLTAR